MENRRMCPHCRAFITTSDRVCPYCHETVGPRSAGARDPGQILGGFIPHARFTTVIIMVLNTALFLATVVFTMNSGAGDVMAIDGTTLLKFGAKLPILILGYGQWWRLVTAGFLHGGLMHILMNSWVMFDLGAQVEEVYGATRLIVIYFCSTIGGFLASTLLSASLSVGASAGIFGLIGAMIALGVTHKSALGAAIRGLYIRWAIYGLLFGLLPMFRVDNAAHIGGLAAGFLAAWIAGLPGFHAHWKENLLRGASYVCLALTAISFLEMYKWFSSSPQ
jgi:rhomboid protease GluP